MAFENFSWAAAADSGLGLLKGLSAWSNTRASNSLSSAQADAANLIRESQNKVRNAQSGLAASIRAMNETRALTAAGKQFNAAGENLARQQDSFTRGNFEAGLADAEKMGALQARGAASGTGGTALLAMSYSTSLQQGRMQQMRTEQQGQVTYDQALVMAGIMPAAQNSRQFAAAGGGLDMGRNLPNRQGNSLVAALAAGLFSKADSLNVMLGSLEARNGTATGSQDSGATTSPVTQSNVYGVDLDPFSGVSSTPVLGGVQSYPVNQSVLEPKNLGTL